MQPGAPSRVPTGALPSNLRPTVGEKRPAPAAQRDGRGRARPQSVSFAPGRATEATVCVVDGDRTYRLRNLDLSARTLADLERIAAVYTKANPALHRFFSGTVCLTTRGVALSALGVRDGATLRLETKPSLTVFARACSGRPRRPPASAGGMHPRAPSRRGRPPAAAAVAMVATRSASPPRSTRPSSRPCGWGGSRAGRRRRSVRPSPCDGAARPGTAVPQCRSPAEGARAARRGGGGRYDGDAAHSVRARIPVAVAPRCKLPDGTRRR